LTDETLRLGQSDVDSLSAKRALRGFYWVMTRRKFLQSTSGPAFLLGPVRKAASAGGPPNIVFFYTDDQARWTLGSYGNRESHTPNMDRIGREGAVFERAFASTPVCSPARAALLTSQYSFRTGVHDFLNPRKVPEEGLPTHFPTWPQLLQQAGYTTGLVGKWHLGLRPEFHPTRRGYHHFMGFLEGGNSPEDPLLEVNGKRQEVPGYLPQLLADDAIAFIGKNRSKPFLLSMHFRAPHGPHTPVPEADDALFRDKKLELPAYEGVDPDWLLSRRRDYYKSIASADRAIGRVLDELEKLDLAGNTVVVFTSDQGFMIGQHGLRGKGNATWARKGRSGRRPNMFDDSILAPMTLRWPGVVRPGTRISDMVSHLDFYPTLLTIAGAQDENPSGYVPCGHDLAPLLHGQRVPWRNTVFGDYNMRHYYEDAMRMIRTEDWKLVTHSSPEFQDELYHLREDPEEKNNLIGDNSLLEKSRELRGRLRAWQLWMGDPAA